MTRVIRKLEPVEPPDGRGWAVWTLLAGLAAGVAWVVWTKADFADPMPWRNGWVLLAGLALTTAGLVWASLRLKGRNMRRFQVGVLVSLLLHLWGAVAMERLNLALSIVPPAETEREAPTPNLAPTPEYYIEPVQPPTSETTPEQPEYERPVATETPQAEAAEVPRQEHETTPNRSEALAASQAEPTSTVEPSPAEMARAAEAAARRSPQTSQLSRREATSATVSGEAAEAPPVEQPQQPSPRTDAAPAELERTATSSAAAPAVPTPSDAPRPSASAPAAARAVAQDAPQSRESSPTASRATAAAAAPELAAADVQATAAPAASAQPAAASTALARQATGGQAPSAIAAAETAQPSAATSLARSAAGALGAPQVSAGGSAASRAAAGGTQSQESIQAPALASAAAGGQSPAAQTASLAQSSSQVAGASGGLIGAAAGDAPSAGSLAAAAATGARSSASPSVAMALGSSGDRAAASGAVAATAVDTSAAGDVGGEAAAAVAQGPARTAVGRENTSPATAAAATQVGAGGSPGLPSPTALARAASGQGDAAQPSVALGPQPAVGRAVAQADLPSQTSPGDEGPPAADQAAGLPEAVAPASGGGLGRLASSGPAAGSASATDEGLNPSPGQPLATGSPQPAVGALSPGVSLGSSSGRLASAAAISSSAADLADPGLGPMGAGLAGAPAPTATTLGRSGSGNQAQPTAGGFATGGDGGPAASSSGLARSADAGAAGPQTAAVGAGAGRRAAASAVAAIEGAAEAPDAGEAAADAGGPAASQIGLARSETGAPSDLGAGPPSPSSGSVPGALTGGGPARAVAGASPGPSASAGGGRAGRRTASAVPSELIADLPDEGSPAAAAGAAGGAPAPGDQPDRRSSGGLPVQVAAVDGPGGLGPQPSSNAGVPNRLARTDSNLIQANTGRFLRRDAGAPQAIDTRALDRAAPFAGRQRGGNLPPGANPGAAGGRTERAIELGLDFLARHQSPDGRWSLHDYAQGREGYPNEADAAALRSDSAATGLALLAFLGAGYDHVTGDRHQPVVAKGIDFLVGNQQANGDLYVREDAKSNESAWLYSHAIATIALCEAYGMTGDIKLREPAQRAIDFAVSSQHKTLGGWRYRPGFEADTSVTGWMLMALKSGELAGLDVPRESYERVRQWLDSAEAGREGQYVYNPLAPDTAERRQGREPTNTMTAVGLLMRLYLGKNREDPELARGAEVLVRNLPDLGTYASRSRDTYYWYYATQVMFHMRGDHWKSWNERLHPLLVGSQLQRGPLAGSWDPRRPVPDRWGPQAGRIYVTTMNLLSLEVTYRHLPIYDSTAQ
jgi:hypothetical protein